MRSISNTLRFRNSRISYLLQNHRSPYHSQTASRAPEYEEFFRYTSHRWLWDEQARLKERYRWFDVAALQKTAALSVGASHCVSMAKLAEGGYNKVFRLVMDNDSVVIARIPHLYAGSRFRAVASEVATMDFASRILNIPVPQVLAWEASTGNPVKSEYILMEEAAGIQLDDTWQSMNVRSKTQIVEQLVTIAKKLVSVSFSHYGNIYFSSDNVSGCRPPSVEGSLAQDVKAEITDRYVIGPAVDSSFWDKERGTIPNIHGPWSNAQDYIKAIAKREITWLNKYAVHQTQTGLPFQSAIQRSPESHVALYQKLLNASNHILPPEPELVRATLWHWDLHASNIFVTDSKITGVIDWQDCWAAPLVLQAQRPQLVNYQGDVMLTLPSHYKSLEEGPEKEQIRSDVEQSTLLLSYESKTRRENPVLDRIFQLPQGQTIKDTMAFATNTWDTDIVPFRECLIRLYRHWNEVCPGQQCPFAFTQEELDAHTHEGEDWNEKADFWSSISGLVDRDGMLSPEDFDEALAFFAKLREEGLKSFEGDERIEFERATRWAR